MLVLSRAIGAHITIGDNITVTVCKVRGDEVWLGIDAPRDVPVHRSEVYEAIKRQEATNRRDNANPT